MNLPHRAALLACAFLGLLGSGCINHEETVYQDEPRMKVEFESDTAGRIFYEALSTRSGKASDKTESSTHVSIPVVFDHHRRVVRGENHTFNEGVRRCDTNGDGRITEQEARIYAGQN